MDNFLDNGGAGICTPEFMGDNPKPALSHPHCGLKITHNKILWQQSTRKFGRRFDAIAIGKEKTLIDNFLKGNYTESSMKLLINLNYDFEYRGFVAECPSLPGCVSQGKTKEETLENIREAISGYIKVLKKHHQTAPLEAITPCFLEVTV